MKNSIEKVALATKFKEEDLDSILLICSKTENSSIAISMLLGIYEEPKFKSTAEDTESHTNRQFVSYCPFKDKVTYSTNKVNKVYAWFKKGDELTEKNIASNQSWYDDAMASLNFTGSRTEFEKIYHKVAYKVDVEENRTETTCNSSSWPQD